MPQENLDAVNDAIWEFLKVNRNDPETWYKAPVGRAGNCEPGLTECAVCIR